MKKNQIELDSAKHEMYFKNKGCNNLDVCKALCCRGWDINLALEEYESGRYKSEPFCSKDKEVCSSLNKSCPHRSFRVKKNKDGGCVYLNKENVCSIYSMRPIVCRNFMCDNGFKLEPICSPIEDTTEDIEICYFEGGLDLKAKYLYNPYLRLKKFSKAKNSMTLIFKDITSCKDKIVNLIGLDYFSKKKDIVYLLEQFNGKNNLSFIRKKLAKVISKDDFQNLIFYLIDEKVLIGLFG